MADPATPLLSSETPAAAAASQEATNARMLNETLGRLIAAGGSGSADIIAALNTIATAITNSLIGGTTGVNANRLLVSKGTGGFALQPTVVTVDPVTGAITGATLTPSEIAFAATKRALGRNTTGAGAGEEVTASQILDWLGTPARGDLTRRGASAWELLPVGSNGQVLTSDGTDPAWATPAAGGIATIASGSLSGTAVTITGIPETYAYLALQILGGSSDTAARIPLVRASVNNGSSYDATAGNYPGDYWDAGGATYQSTTLASLAETASLASAASVFNMTVTIFNYQTGPHKTVEFRYVDAGGASYRGRKFYIGSTDNIDALQILWNGSGSFDAGTYALYGIS